MKNKLKKLIKDAPNHKVYIEVITAAISVPVMFTVLILNLNNLSKKPAAPAAAPTPAQSEVIIKTVPDGEKPIAQASTKQESAPVTTPTSEACKKQIGPIDISYPQEGATINDNPLTIIIKHDDDTYCSVVWSYRINGGPWSEYSSNSISLYNMPSGDKKFELRVQSTVSGDQTQLTRNFNYQGSDDNSATSSAH